MENTVEILQTLQNIQSILEVVIVILVGMCLFIIIKFLVSILNWMTGG